jgi:hypothetical protein
MTVFVFGILIFTVLLILYIKYGKCIHGWLYFKDKEYRMCAYCHHAQKLNKDTGIYEDTMIPPNQWDDIYFYDIRNGTGIYNNKDDKKDGYGR